MFSNEEWQLLQRELHWRSMPGDRRRPAGSNAITAIGLVITFVLWGITAVVLDRMQDDGPPGSGVIDPSAVVVFGLFGIELLIAAALSGRVWVAIGPRARGLIRPIAVLGPLPTLIIGFFVAVWIVSFVAAPFLPKPPAPVTSGRNWRLMESGRNGMTYDQAVALCEQTGERVPSRDDIAAFDPPFPGGTSAWIERPADENENVLFSLSPDGRIAREVPWAGQPPSRSNVICFRP
jgi:hypothetical protein